MTVCYNLEGSKEVNTMSEVFDQKLFEGERALFKKKDLDIRNSVFQNGESPLKECSNISLENTLFRWKYPMWYGEYFTLKNCTMFEMARAGIWYTRCVAMYDCDIQAPKAFRRSSKIVLDGVTFSRADETLWNCSDIRMKNVTAKGDYFAMNCRDLDIDGLRLDGNYSFDGASDLVIRNSRLLSKDAFWNAENVEVRDSYILGEYLGWNSKNVTLINCVIESNQGMCYMDNLRLENCRLISTDLAFEYSSVNADITGGVDSIKNPLSGRIEADSIGQIILDDPDIPESSAEITVRRSI